MMMRSTDFRSFLNLVSRTSGSQGSESVQEIHTDLSRAILGSIINNINQIPIMPRLSANVSEFLPVLQ